ncbi:hypothetical protein D3C86_2097770 [compost metagenome]
MTAHAQDIDDNIGKISAPPKASVPGRTTTSTPAKPHSTGSQRCNPARSPSTTRASSMTNRGDANTIAVASACGIDRSA